MKHNPYISSLIQFIALITLQIVIISQDFVILHGLGFCFIYVLFLLQLPIGLSRVLAMTIAFFTGLIVDIFYNTAGINAAASVLIIFLRPSIIKALAPQSGLENVQRITISSVGFSWFSIYALIMVFIHHLILFSIQVFNAQYFWNTLLKILVSTVFTYTTIIVLQYFFYTERRKR